MSVQNIKGAIFAILNKQGYYDIFSPDGHRIDILMNTIRISQSASDVDKVVIIGPVNIVTDEKQMKEIIEG